MASHFIAFSSSLLSDAWRPLSTQDTHCALFNQVPVLLECLSIPLTSAACVCWWLAGKGGERGCERVVASVFSTRSTSRRLRSRCRRRRSGATSAGLLARIFRRIFWRAIRRCAARRDRCSSAPSPRQSNPYCRAARAGGVRRLFSIESVWIIFNRVCLSIECGWDSAV